MAYTKIGEFSQLKSPRVDQDFHAGKNGGQMRSQRSMS